MTIGDVLVDTGDSAPPPPADTMIDAPPGVTCSTSGLTCAGQTMAAICNGTCWVKCTSAAPIAGQLMADIACTAWGGKLAPIRSAADQQCVVGVLFPDQAHWIGLEQSSIATTVATDWTWNGDGVAITFTGWGNGQPNDLNGNENDHAEQCAFINNVGDWHDEDCGNGGLYRFSCRK